MNIKQNKNLPYYIVIGVVTAGIIFGGFEIFHLSKNGNSNATAEDNQAGQSFSNNNQNGSNSRQRGRGNFQHIQGTISSLDSTNKKITITASDNSTKNITLTSDARISEQLNGQMTQLSFSDLKTGDKIAVMSSSTGSDIQARMIIVGDFTPPQRNQNSDGNDYQGGGNYGGGESWNSNNGSDGRSDYQGGGYGDNDSFQNDSSDSTSSSI